MKYQFHACGHPNIRGTHKTTLEFTKDKEVSLKGDCIIGVRADFELQKLKEFMKKADKVKIIIEAGGIRDEIDAVINPNFNSDREMVIRKGNFASERTFGVNADKGAFELDNKIINKLKDKNSCMRISLLNQ
jgi:hypothetical protein